MLNNIHFVALHVLMSTVPSFAISSQGRFIKLDATLMLLIGSRLKFAVPHIYYCLV